MLDLNEENIEMYIMCLVDDELSEQDKTLVLNFIKGREDLESLYLDFLSVKLPHETIIYPDMSSLFREEEVSKKAIPTSSSKAVAFVARKWLVGAAAVLTLSVGGYTYWATNSNRIIEEQSLVDNQPPNTTLSDNTALEANETQQSMPVVKGRVVASNKAVVQQPSRRSHLAKHVSEQQANTLTEDGSSSIFSAPLALVSRELLQEKRMSEGVKLTIANRIAEQMPEIVSEPKETLLSKQLDKYPMVAEVSSDFTDKFVKVVDVVSDLKEVSISFNIGSKVIKIK